MTEENAHPHYDTQDRVHVVVNGIVENYLELKQELVADGAVFTSETDAEVIAHLISRAPRRTATSTSAVRAAYGELRGHYAFVAVAADEPGMLVAARKECPLVVGRGDGEQFVASAIPAFLAHTRDVQLIENGEIVALRPDGVEFMVADGDAPSSARSSAWTGTPTSPRRAATRRSCSRRSTSRPTRSPRRSPTARCAATASTSATWARSTTRSWRGCGGS